MMRLLEQDLQNLNLHQRSLNGSEVKLCVACVPVLQGATIRRDEETGGIFIARVIHGGLADRSGETM